jgi:hypothetical protein
MKTASFVETTNTGFDRSDSKSEPRNKVLNACRSTDGLARQSAKSHFDWSIERVPYGDILALVLSKLVTVL